MSEKETAEESRSEPDYVGEIVIRMTPDKTFDVDCRRSGLIGPGLFEGAVPLILNRLMQAIAARDRAMSLASREQE